MKSGWLLLFLSTGVVHAQQRDLAFYINQAAVNSPVIQDNKNQQQALSIEASRLKAQYTKPQLSLSADYLLAPVLDRDKGIIINPKDNTNYIGYEIGATNGGVYKALVNIDQPLWNAGRYKTAAEQVTVSAQINANNILLTTHDIEKLVTDQYILCLQDAHQANYSAQMLAIVNEQTALVQKLVGAGITLQSDLTLMHIEQQTQLTALNNWQASYHRDLLDLNVLCGIPDTVQVVLPDLALQLKPAANNSLFEEKYRLDSLTLAVSARMFDLKYKPQVNLFANSGLNATYLPDAGNRFGVSAGISFIMVLTDGKQRHLNQQKTDFLVRSAQAYKQNFITQNTVRKQRIAGELRAADDRLSLMQQQLKDYNELLLSYKAALVKGQLSVINYTNTLKNVAALQRDYVLLQTNRLLLINAYNYWNW